MVLLQQIVVSNTDNQTSEPVLDIVCHKAFSISKNYETRDTDDELTRLTIRVCEE